MMTVYVIAQPSGSSGKSTTAAELLLALTVQGGAKQRRVVGVDCDVSATLLLRKGFTRDSTVAASARDVLTGRVSAAQATTPSATVPGVSVVACFPGNADRSRYDNELLVAALREQLARLQEDFDDVVIDTPPGTSWHTLAAVAVAEVLITPVPVTVEAWLALDLLAGAIEDDLTGLLERSFRRWRFIPIRFDHRRALDMEILEHLREEYAAHPSVVTAPVRESALVRAATVAGQSVSVYAPDSEVAADFGKALAAVITAGTSPSA